MVLVMEIVWEKCYSGIMSDLLRFKYCCVPENWNENSNLRLFKQENSRELVKGCLALSSQKESSWK